MNKSDVNTNNRMVYTVDEIAKMLGIGRTAAYALVNMEHPPFRVLRVCGSIRILKASFERWLYGED